MDMRHLPLTALRAFAVTAEYGSVSRAAAELGVTHSAVSRNLGVLESLLGQRLFDRRGKSLEITPIGSRLAAEITQSLHRMISCCDEVGSPIHRRTISIEAPATFAMYWLLPRVHRYESVNASIEIDITTRMTNDPPGFSGSDILITRGVYTGQSRRFPRRRVLLQEDVTVVTSQSFFDRHKISTIEDLMASPSISATTRPDDWAHWLDSFGLPDSKFTMKHRFDHLFVAMHAVRDGVGSIVAPFNLFKDYEGTKFVAPFADMSIAGEAYIVHLRSDAEPGYLRSFIDWLASSAQPGR